MAIQMLYQQELGGTSLQEVFSSFDVDCFLEATESADEDSIEAESVQAPPPSHRQAQDSFEHARQLVEGTLLRRNELDDLIRRQAENWRLERMPAIDRNILRLAIYEMLYGDGVPQIVVVDEAIELAKKFGSEDSSRFVNGLLDGILTSVRSGKVPQKQASGGSP